MSHTLGRSVLLGGNPDRWSWESRQGNLKFETGIDAWPVALQGHRIGGKPPESRELRDFDLVMANSNEQFIADYLPLVESRPKGQKWVTLIEGDCRMYWRVWPEFRRLLDASDLLITINALTEPFFRSLTTTPTINLGVPYPVEDIVAMAVEPAKRKRIAMICNKEEQLPSICVGRGAELPMEMYVKKVSRQVKNLPFFVRHRSFDRSLSLTLTERAVDYPGMKVHSHNRDWRAFIAHSAHFHLWINMDPRYTWGRYVLDAAALRVPIITTESTAHGPTLFPETTVRDCFDVERAIEIARRAWTDEAFVKRVADEAFEKVWEFTPEKSVRKLEAALSSK